MRTLNMTPYLDLTLTGRSALSQYHIGVSTDPRVIMVVLDDLPYEEKFVHNLWLIRNDSHEIINGKVSKNQAIYDMLKYDYDDSCIYEFLECVDEEELLSFREFLSKKSDKLEDKIKRYNFFGDLR